MKFSVEVINRQRKIKISIKRVITRAKKIISVLYDNKDENLLKITDNNLNMLCISIIFVGERKMKELNFRYRGKQATTDVLSFPYLEQDLPGSLFVGEIIINLNRVLSQANQYNVKFSQELNRILIHGILHLIGYEHEYSASQARRMRKLEEKILSQLQS